MTRKWPVVGVLLAGLWLFVRGVELHLNHVLGEFLIGLGVGLPLAYATRRLYLPEVDLGGGLRRLPKGVLYVAVFLRELLTANLDVAYRVLHPGLPIEPDVIELPLRVEGDAAITTIANSITLTPGTLTMDHDPDTNTLYVHGIVGQRREQTVAPIRRFEDLLLLVFDEDASPSDDPPTPGQRRAARRAAAETEDDDGSRDDEPTAGGSGDEAEDDGGDGDGR